MTSGIPKRKIHPKIYFRTGGSGETTFLLLHGLGATGEVWRETQNIIDEKKLGRWVIPDMRGHGKSEWAKSYGLGEHSFDIASLVKNRKKIIIVGHSMGGLIALSIATGWFGIEIAGVVAIGTMINWNENDTKRYLELAKKKPRWFDNYEEAAARYLKVSGLWGLISPISKQAKSGVIEVNGKFRLAADNAVGTIGGPWMRNLIEIIKCPLIAAAGELDPIVSSRNYKPFTKNVVSIPSVAHNAQVEDPQSIISLINKIQKEGNA